MNERLRTSNALRFATARTPLLAVAGLLVATPILAGCGDLDIEIDSWGDIDGSGDIITTDVTVDDFHRIDVSSQFRVVATVSDDAEPSVSFEIDDNLVDYVDIRVEGETLVVGFDVDGIDPSERPIVTVTIGELLSVEASGASEIVATGIDSDDFDVDATGASRVEVAGTAGDLTVRTSGASSADLFDLEVETVDVDLSGASSVDVTASDRVVGEASGASSVEVGGDASIDVDTSGAASTGRKN